MVLCTKNIFKVFSLLMLVGLFSCNNFSLYNEDTSVVVARVGEVELTEDMLLELYGELTSANDSSSTRDYAINDWVVMELKTQSAEQELVSGGLDKQKIERMVEEYRKALLIHSLETKYLLEHLDTTFTDKQIKDYYNENPSAFRLAGPLVRAIVVRLPEGLRQSKSLREMFLKGGDEELSEFINICAKNGYKVEDLRGSWVEFSTVLGHIPFRRTNFDEFLKKNRTYEVTDEEYKYLLRIIEYLPTGAQSPLEREQETIKRILKNRRRADAVDQLNSTLLESAKESEQVVIE